MSEQKKPASPAPRSEVTLKKPHTHAGEYYDAKAVKDGVKINVTDSQKAWLKAQDII
jgi:hypothetical protein